MRPQYGGDGRKCNTQQMHCKNKIYMHKMFCNFIKRHRRSDDEAYKNITWQSLNKNKRKKIILQTLCTRFVIARSFALESA